MDSQQDTYYIESLEQLRAIADTLRIRIIELVSNEPHTVTQIAERLALPANKVHYHVRELERVGLLQLVETRERGGILEKYYRPVARSIQVPEALLSQTPPDETIHLVTDMLHDISDNAIQAIRSKLATNDPGEHVALVLDTPSLTNEEFRQLLQQVADLFKPYAQPRGLQDERMRRVVLIAHDVAPASQQHGKTEVKEPPHPATQEKRSRMMGVLAYSRKDLELLVSQQTQLDIAVVGVVILLNDITPDLAQRAIRRLSVRGKLIAPLAVREALEQKGIIISN